jgi:cell division protein FtsB
MLIRIIKKIIPFLKNKFFLATFVFVAWILFFDQNNLVERVKIIKQKHELKREKEYYIEKIKTDTRELNELRTDRENLEKFAREQYYMKKDGEDIFIVVDD